MNGCNENTGQLSMCSVGMSIPFSPDIWKIDEGIINTEVCDPVDAENDAETGQCERSVGW
jgi:hypothetical protein